MRYILVVVLLGSASACGGYNASAPTSPSASNPPPANAVVIEVVSINGTQSFRPNPSTVPAGQLVVWHNVDSITHRVVFDDGEVDSGNLAPGASSVPTEVAAAGSYHCSIHPEMVGRTVDGK